MAYTVAYCDKFMDELLDKMGSDYFPLEVKLKRFESITLQFIRETTNFLEATQEISDDIINLVISPQLSVSQTKQNYMGKDFYKVPYPSNYIRLLNVVPTAQNTQVKRNEIKLYRIGNFLNNEQNPFRKAINGVINVYRIDNAVLIDTDQTISNVNFTYIKKPTFGVSPTDAMVNLGDLVVDKLMSKTCVSLRATSSDADTTFMDDYVERQGQKTK